MTDKQIIIDGVDVSGCIFHSLTIMSYAGCNYYKCFECACECHNDCYYKQLKRKERECEKINLTNERLVAEKYIMNEEILKLKAKEQECEELKKANDGILTTIRILAKNNIKLREILAEIKEIAEIEIECKTYGIENDCFNKTRCKALNEHIDFIKQILQKISEV